MVSKTPTAQTLADMDSGANIVLRSENIDGNLHAAAHTINQTKGLAQYVLAMDSGGSYSSTIVVFRGPDIILDTLLKRKR